MQQIKNPFWKDVLKYCKELCTKYTPSSVHEFMSENIHYNINIIRGRKVACNRGWLADNILFIRQLMISNESFLVFF